MQPLHQRQSLCLSTPHRHLKQLALLAAFEQIQPGAHRFKIRRIRQCKLQAGDPQLQPIQVVLAQGTTPMEQPHMVAHILQLSQIVTGDHHRRAVLCHKVHQQFLHQFPHHRVQAVKNLVKQDTARLGGQPQQNRSLALHTLTHLAQPSVKGNGKQLFHPGKVVLAPPGIHAAVQPCQPPHGGGGS